MTAEDASPAERLATPVQFLRGVGPQRAELFARLGLHTARDLLFFFPRGYEDLTQQRAVDELVEEETASVVGEVIEINLRNTSRGPLLSVRLHDGASELQGVWFHQPFLAKRFHSGQRVAFYGKPKRRGGGWQMTHPHVIPLDTEESDLATGLWPIYRLTEGLRQGSLRRAMRSALDSAADALDEVMPESLRQRFDLLGIHQAIPWIHFPEGPEQRDQARRRFVFQELYVLQLALALRRHRLTHQQRAPSLQATAKIDARIRRLLPFELTSGQEQVLAEICQDLAREVPMNRLLQGDVGTGKTVLAVYALMTCVAHGYQAALMAPTEILAEQHTATLGQVLAASKVRVVRLTGGLTAKERQAALAALAAGEADVVMGTHALASEDVKFAKLGLVIIDEQHKFGVQQRAALRRAGLDPHYLVLTATPIPRSLAMTVFGDLDISTLREAPPGRQQVHTYLVEADRTAKWWEFVRRKLREGRQAYVVAPRIEADDEQESAGAEQLLEQLANGELGEFRLDLIHGRLTSRQKTAAMEAFRSGTTDVLVSTSVVEVGVDVPNATLMYIEGADRFGLAQLHQLRGRVSRGTTPGYCGLVAEANQGPARDRLEAFINTDDGFELAEIDFALRGPGDLLGTQQHGLPPLRIADLVRDQEILQQARAAARQVIDRDPGLTAAEHALLRRSVLVRYGKTLDLGDVG